MELIKELFLVMNIELYIKIKLVLYMEILLEKKRKEIIIK
jgi:hypothetical protein